VIIQLVALLGLALKAGQWLVSAGSVIATLKKMGSSRKKILKRKIYTMDTVPSFQIAPEQAKYRGFHCVPNTPRREPIIFPCMKEMEDTETDEMKLGIMSVTELKSIAKQGLGLKISAKAKKRDIINAIIEATP
jgi:hypothetical protein